MDFNHFYGDGFLLNRYFQLKILQYSLLVFAAVFALLSLLLESRGIALRNQNDANIIFSFHIVSLSISIVLLFVSTFSSLFYAIEHKALKSKRIDSFFPMSSLETYDKVAFQTLVGHLFLLTLSIFSGIYIAHFFWDRNWVSEPKFLIGVVVWAFVLAIILVRVKMGIRGVKFLLLNASSFVLLVLVLVFSWVWGKI